MIERIELKIRGIETIPRDIVNLLINQDIVVLSIFDKNLFNHVLENLHSARLHYVLISGSGEGYIFYISQFVSERIGKAVDDYYESRAGGV